MTNISSTATGASSSLSSLLAFHIGAGGGVGVVVVVVVVVLAFAAFPPFYIYLFILVAKEVRTSVMSFANPGDECDNITPWCYSVYGEHGGLAPHHCVVSRFTLGRITGEV
ncbi:hypothetical protein F5Y07DRAFT_335838 [Xylaria sp. FL0933]|nr:hypothetical protein F5Y07DRAFT_335838 [Xylaria sp. FL0933]